MSAQAWLMFCAACVAVFAFPSALAYVVASYSVVRGKKTALSSVSGATLGMVTAMTAAALVTVAAALLSEQLLGILQWVGLAWLILFAFWVLATPAAASATADNDNLPAKGSLGIFVSCYIGALRPRYLAFFAALLPQFVETARDGILTFVEMQALVLVLTFACSLAHVIFARKTMSLVRQMSTGKTARKPRPTHFISGRAVTAGYRRIAA
jgi:threonine/homoserine/homoserine lactone efflux protein